MMTHFEMPDSVFSSVVYATFPNTITGLTFSSMKKEYSDHLPLVELLVRNSCELCVAVATKLIVAHDREHLFKLVITNIDTTGDTVPPNRKHLTPAVWVNDELWYTGDFDTRHLTDKIKTRYMYLNDQ